MKRILIRTLFKKNQRWPDRKGWARANHHWEQVSRQLAALRAAYPAATAQAIINRVALQWNIGGADSSIITRPLLTVAPQRRGLGCLILNGGETAIRHVLLFSWQGGLVCRLDLDTAQGNCFWVAYHDGQATPPIEMVMTWVADRCRQYNCSHLVIQCPIPDAALQPCPVPWSARHFL